MDDQIFKGRGAQLKTENRFLQHQYVSEHVEGLDEEMLVAPQTQLFYENAKGIVNKVESPDVPLSFSINAYQGCEHGCVYCYARQTHEYWGFSAGLDFESKIVVKKNAPDLLEQTFLKKSWKCHPIMMSGNTDCYQPLEKKLGLTRKLLSVFAKYRNPVGIITKNSLIERDLDLLKDLAADRLVHVYLSITTLDEKLRSKLEPRTASAAKKLKTIEVLSKAGVPVGVMNAPIIPGLNHHEIPTIIEQAAAHGALSAGYTVVRLNGTIGQVFKDWLEKYYPDRVKKVWNQTSSLHGGDVHDTKAGRRTRGDGPMADIINKLFKAAYKKYMEGKEMPTYNLTAFRRGGNLNLF